MSALLRASTVALALAAAGCGSQPAAELPVPEPAASPAPREEPAGRVVDVGNAPEGVAVDPESGIVALGFRNPNRLALVDGESGRVRREVRLPSSPRHLGLAGPGGPVLVPTEDGGSLVQVGLPDGRIEEETRVGREPHDAAGPASGRIFVGNEFEDSLSVVENGRDVRRLPVTRQPGGVAVTENGQAAVVSVTGREFEIFDTRTLRSLGRAPGGVGPTHVVAEPEGCFYVADTQGDAVLLLRTQGGRVIQVRRINVPGTPYGIAVDPAADRLWVTQTKLNRIVEYALNGRRPRFLRSLPTVRQPNTVGVDPGTGRVYVAGRAGELQIIEPAENRAAPPEPDDGRARCG